MLEITALGSAPPPKARATDVTLFTRQLAGLPLAPCLELIADTPSCGDLPRIVGSVARDITQGVAFLEALARHPTCFNALYCQLVAVGELAGVLPVVLLQLPIFFGESETESRISVSLTNPRQTTILPGGGSLARAR